MKINSNIQGMIAQSILASNEEKMRASTERMSSGFKLNHAKDNPAGMAITNRMRAQLKSLDRASKNASNGINAIQTAEGAMSEIEDMLQRMNELAIQASNGTMTTADREAVQEEVSQLCNEIERISKDTTYNSQGLLDGSQELKAYSENPDAITVRDYNEQMDLGKYTVTFDPASGDVTLEDSNGDPVTTTTKKIDVYKELQDDGTEKITGFSTTITTLDGGQLIIDKKVLEDDPSADVYTSVIDLKGLGGMKVQTGAEEGQEIQVIIPKISLKTLGLNDLKDELRIDCKTETGAKEAINLVKNAIDYVSAARSKLGAYQNRLERTVKNLDVTIENLTDSLSTIKDLDMAEGMVEYTTQQVLVQAGTTMVAQSNEQPQQALQLFQ